MLARIKQWPRVSVVSYALLLAYAAVLVAVSWQRWGNPISDVGLDLTVARDWVKGSIPYESTRYWYGPLGIGVLAIAFAIFGSTLAVASGVGLAITALIAELSRRLALRWLPVPVAASTVAVVLSIGFSGTLFNFQLPHTFAATTALAALLLALLCLTRERFLAAGLAIGLTALARPEFLGFGLAALGGAALGSVRAYGWIRAIKQTLIAGVAAAVVAVPVYGLLMANSGVHRVLFENVIPLEFIKAVGSTFEHDQHPFDLPSFGTLLLRGVLICTLVWLFLLGWSAVANRGQADPRLRRSIRKALMLFGVGVLGAFVLAAIGGDAGEPARLVKSDATRLLFAMTALPAIGLSMLVVGAIAWFKKGPPPLAWPADDLEGERIRSDARSAAVLSGSSEGRSAALTPGWVGAGALIALAAACSLRSYAQFSTDVYGTYYAPPVVLLAAIVLHRVAIGPARQRWEAATAVLAIAAASLSAHAIIGNYRDYTSPVKSTVGQYKAEANIGPAIQGVIDLLEPKIRPGEKILALPQEPGFYFMLRASPALYDGTFLPGVLGTPTQDAIAAKQLTIGDRGYNPPNSGTPSGRLTVYQLGGPKARFVIEGNWNFALWGFDREGVDVNVELHKAIVKNYRVIGRFGDTTKLPPRISVGTGYTVYERR